MVLKIAAVLYSFFPTQYLPHTFICIVAILVVRAFSQGRVTNRERDLHARVILVTVSCVHLKVSYWCLFLIGWLYASRTHSPAVLGSTWSPYHCTDSPSNRCPRNLNTRHPPSIDDFERADLRRTVRSYIAYVHQSVLYQIPHGERTEARCLDICTRVSACRSCGTSGSSQRSRCDKRERREIIGYLPDDHSPSSGPFSCACRA